MTKMDYDSGFKAIKKQILPAINRRKKIRNEESDIDEELGKHTHNLLNRCAPDWMKGEKKDKDKPKVDHD